MQQDPAGATAAGSGQALRLGGGQLAGRALATRSPTLLCEPSQNGLFANCPQRQRETTVRPARPQTFPSSSAIAMLSPSTRSGPLFRTMMRLSARRASSVHYKAWARSRHGWDTLRCRPSARAPGGRSDQLRRHGMALAVALALLLPSTRADAQWASLGAMPAPRRERSALVFRNAQGTVAVSALSPDVVRVRFAPTSSLGRDHSYAILTPPAGDAAARGSRSARRRRPSHVRACGHRQARALPRRLRHRRRRVARRGRPRRAASAFAAATTRVWKRLRDDEHVYGLGEKTGRLNKRGRNRGGYSVRDVEQRHLRLRRRHGPHLRLRSRSTS